MNDKTIQPQDIALMYDIEDSGWQTSNHRLFVGHREASLQPKHFFVDRNHLGHFSVELTLTLVQGMKFAIDYKGVKFPDFYIPGQISSMDSEVGFMKLTLYGTDVKILQVGSIQIIQLKAFASKDDYFSWALQVRERGKQIPFHLRPHKLPPYMPSCKFWFDNQYLQCAVNPRAGDCTGCTELEIDPQRLRISKRGI